MSNKSNYLRHDRRHVRETDLVGSVLQLVDQVFRELDREGPILELDVDQEQLVGLVNDRHRRQKRNLGTIHWEGALRFVDLLTVTNSLCMRNGLPSRDPRR